jgi:ligand-binding sensor domain-containing protein
MLGNWIIRQRQNPYDNKVWMTNWITLPGDRQGLVATSDKGFTFEQHLVNEDILDITFNGSTIFAAGRNGLFISPDNGTTWIKQPQIRSSNSFLKENASFQTAAKTTERVWIGTNDGLISTSNNGQSWEITRVDFPMSGGNIFLSSSSETNTYAYPSPFSRTQDGIIRIRFNATSTGTASVELMDFGMDRIVRLPDVQVNQPGIYEVSWNGLSSNGGRVANGPVFYSINVGGERINGKFLMLD